MKKYLFHFFLSVAVAAIGIASAGAETAPASKSTKKAHTKKAAAPKKDEAFSDEDDKEPDTSGTATEYACDLGTRITIYHNDDEKHIALRWNKQLHRLTRVGTTTGANRFENRKYGLLWIGIPAKSILLDSKKGQQLANGCMNAEQRAPAASAPVAVEAKKEDAKKEEAKKD